MMIIFHMDMLPQIALIEHPESIACDLFKVTNEPLPLSETMIELGVLRQQAVKGGSEHDLMNYMLALEYLLPYNLRLHHGLLLGHCQSDDPQQKHQYATLVGEYAIVALVLARVCSEARHAAYTLRRAAEKLGSLPAQIVFPALDEAGVQSDVEYFELLSKALRAKAKQEFDTGQAWLQLRELIEAVGRASLAPELRAGIESEIASIRSAIMNSHAAHLADRVNRLEPVQWDRDLLREAYLANHVTKRDGTLIVQVAERSNGTWNLINEFSALETGALEEITQKLEELANEASMRLETVPTLKDEEARWNKANVLLSFRSSFEKEWAPRYTVNDPRFQMPVPEGETLGSVEPKSLTAAALLFGRLAATGEFPELREEANRILLASGVRQELLDAVTEMKPSVMYALFGRKAPENKTSVWWSRLRTFFKRDAATVTPKPPPPSREPLSFEQWRASPTLSAAEWKARGDVPQDWVAWFGEEAWRSVREWFGRYHPHEWAALGLKREHLEHLRLGSAAALLTTRTDIDQAIQVWDLPFR